MGKSLPMLLYRSPAAGSPGLAAAAFRGGRLPLCECHEAASTESRPSSLTLLLFFSGVLSAGRATPPAHRPPRPLTPLGSHLGAASSQMTDFEEDDDHDGPAKGEHAAVAAAAPVAAAAAVSSPKARASARPQTRVDAGAVPPQVRSWCCTS